MSPGLIGGILGGVIGVAGGVVGTVASFRRANGPCERRLVLRASLFMWATVLLFVAGLLLLPPLYRWFLWVPYSVVLPLMIMYWNHNVEKARAQDTGEHESVVE